jgi:hypothetical protein
MMKGCDACDSAVFRDSKAASGTPPSPTNGELSVLVTARLRKKKPRHQFGIGNVEA